MTDINWTKTGIYYYVVVAREEYKEEEVLYFQGNYSSKELENISFIRYRKDRWTADLKLIHAKYGGEITGDTTNYGSDIFITYNENFKELGNDIAQGNTSNLKIIDIRV